MEREGEIYPGTEKYGGKIDTREKEKERKRRKKEREKAGR